MRARTIVTAALAVLLAMPAAAAADELQDAVIGLLAEQGKSQVIVEFSVKRTDGTGGQEYKLSGTMVAEDLVLVSGASSVDPKPGTGNAKPELFKVKFPGDLARNAFFVGKDEENNLALLRITEGQEKTEVTPAVFEEKGTFTPGQQVVFLRRLGKDDDHLVTWGSARLVLVVPKPGLPDEYRVQGRLNGFEGCPVYSLDRKLVGYVTAGVRNRGGRFQVIGGRVVRMGGGGGGGPEGPTRILNSTLIREFLADPSRGTRRDCWLGVSGLQAVTKELAEAMGLEGPGGLLIGKVSEKSPAEAAGFQAGDVIVAMGEEAVEIEKDRDIASFQRKVRRAKAGDEVAFSVIRAREQGHAEILVKAKLEESPISEHEVPDYHDQDFGLKLKPLTRDFLENARLPLDSKGVRVTWVEPAGWASIAGIRSGDVIQKMVLKPCPDLDAYKKIMTELMTTRDSEVCYNVSRSRKSLFLCVRPDWSSVPEVEKEK